MFIHIVKPVFTESTINLFLALILFVYNFIFKILSYVENILFCANTEYLSVNGILFFLRSCLLVKIFPFILMFIAMVISVYPF